MLSNSTCCDVMMHACALLYNAYKIFVTKGFRLPNIPISKFCSLSDVMEHIRETATKLWNDIGLQYMEENEEDLKKKADFLKDHPSHYPPDLKRPNLGCRTLVQTNIGKIAPAIWRGNIF